MVSKSKKKKSKSKGANFRATGKNRHTENLAFHGFKQKTQMKHEAET